MKSLINENRKKREQKLKLKKIKKIKGSDDKLKKWRQGRCWNRALGEADWRPPPSNKIALSSSSAASFPLSTKLTSNCLLRNYKKKNYLFFSNKLPLIVIALQRKIWNWALTRWMRVNFSCTTIFCIDPSWNHRKYTEKKRHLEEEFKIQKFF